MEQEKQQGEELKFDKEQKQGEQEQGNELKLEQEQEQVMS